MSDDFNFDELAKEFENLDLGELSSSGRAPKWVELWLESMHDDPMEERGPDGEAVASELGDEYEKFLDRKLAKLRRAQELGEFEIEVLSGEIDPERNGYGMDAQFQVKFNGRTCLIVSHALKAAAGARRMQVAMEAMMRGGTPDEILDEEGISLADDVELLDAFAWLLVDVGTGRVDKVDLPGKES